MAKTILLPVHAALRLTFNEQSCDYTTADSAINDYRQCFGLIIDEQHCRELNRIWQLEWWDVRNDDDSVHSVSASSLPKLMEYVKNNCICQEFAVGDNSLFDDQTDIEKTVTFFLDHNEDMVLCLEDGTLKSPGLVAGLKMLSDDDPVEEFLSEDDMRVCDQTNDYWKVHWYTDTPVGFIRRIASTLELVWS